MFHNSPVMQNLFELTKKTVAVDEHSKQVHALAKQDY